MKKIFTQDYYFGSQDKFKQYLETKDFEKAYSVLENLPKSEKDPLEEIKRILTLAEGYKALTKALLSGERKEEPEGILEKMAKQVDKSQI